MLVGRARRRRRSARRSFDHARLQLLELLLVLGAHLLEQPQRRVRLLLVDLREREADVDQHPVAGRAPPPSSSTSRLTLTLRRTPTTSTLAIWLAASTISTTCPGIAKHMQRSLSVLSLAGARRRPMRLRRRQADRYTTAAFATAGPGVILGTVIVITATLGPRLRPAGTPAAAYTCHGRVPGDATVRGVARELAGERRRLRRWRRYRRRPYALALQRTARERPSSYQYLLDLDDDLADEFDVRMRLVARPAATAVTFEVDAGPLDLARLARGAPRRARACSCSTACSPCTCASATGPPPSSSAAAICSSPGTARTDDLLACEVAWRALVPMRFALLDAAFARARAAVAADQPARCCAAPARRARNLNVQRAIAAQPRLEVRLALLLWHLAARWGKVEPGGIRLPLPLTHQLLGRLVGAERPSVSHALARLAQTGLVTGHGDEWHLHGTPGRSARDDDRAASATAREALVAAVVALRPR